MLTEAPDLSHGALLPLETPLPSVLKAPIGYVLLWGLQLWSQRMQSNLDASIVRIGS